MYALFKKAENTLEINQVYLPISISSDFANYTKKKEKKLNKRLL